MNDLFQIRQRLQKPQIVRNGNGGRRAAQMGKYPAVNQPGNGGAYGGPNKGEAQTFAEQIMGDTVINPTLHHDVGGVSQVVNDDVGESYFTMIFDNSAGGAPVRYRFGSDRAAALAGLSSLPVATSGSNDVDAINNDLPVRPALIGAIFYSTSSDQQQFQQEFRYHKGGKYNGGSMDSYPFPINLAKRPTYENSLLLIIQATTKPWRFGQSEVGTLTVLDGEIVTLDFMLAGSAGNA